MRGEAKTGLIREARLVAVAVIPVAAASVVRQLATYPNLTPWYAGLVKPAFNLPNLVFAPVWTTLYVLMAFGIWRVLWLRRKTPARRLGLTLFFVQLALNAARSWMFFAAHSPVLGMLNIVLHHCGHRDRLLAARPNCWLVYGAARGLGRVCDDPEFLDLVAEHLIR